MNGLLIAAFLVMGGTSDGWIALANGVDIDNFQAVGTAEWMTRTVVQNGQEVPVIYGMNTRIRQNSYLVHKTAYSDFEYIVDIRVPPGVNSGVVFRVPTGVTSGFSGKGYEVQICDSDRRHPTGSIYNIQPAPKGLHRVGDWNEIRVRCEGKRLQVWVNDKPAVDVENDRTQEGHFVYQVHGDPPDWHSVIEIRNPRVRELD